MHTVEYIDQFDGENKKLAAISRDADDIQDSLIIDSIVNKQLPEITIKGN